MVWLFLLQAYVAGFIFISMRAKTVLKLADEHWDKLDDETKRTRVGCGCTEGRHICLFDGPKSKKNKEEYLHYSRNVHIFWFIVSPLWADVCCLISFIKFMVKDINPQLALIFEKDFSMSTKPNVQVYAQENLELRSQIMDMQAQLNKLAKKPAKRKRKTKSNEQD